MIYVVLFVAGAAAGIAPLVIWYSSYLAVLRKERREVKSLKDRLESHSSELTKWAQRLETWKQDLDREFTQRTDDLETNIQALQEAVAVFEARKIGYEDLVKENSSLKQDVFAMSVQAKKAELDHAAITRQHEEISRKTDELAQRYLKENVTWIGAKLTTGNFATSKKRLLKVVEQCRSIGFDISEKEEEELVQDLKANYEQVLRVDFERQEQARIKAQIREEERLAREIDKQTKEAERQQLAVQAALEKALREATDEHSALFEHLRARLKEAEENAQRAKSRAQMTRSGHVYVLSNIGSFGEGVLKVGMTRRLEPMDRVKELGDASVPFPFDVHMMISCDDAPTLENALHRELHKQRVNKVNFRKEFFHTDIESVRKMVEANHGKVDYVADAEALQYREGADMTDEDYEFVEQTVESLMDEEDGFLADE